MKSLIRRISASFSRPVDGVGLAIFRILWSLVLLVEVSQLYKYRVLVYEELAYVNPGHPGFHLLFLVWGLSLIFMMLGLFSRGAALVNYAMTLLFISFLNTYEYHVFYIYIGVNFCLPFLPLSASLSLDNKRRKSPPKAVPVLAYLLPVFIGVGLIYFDSALHKFNSVYWKSGLGMWMPANMPMMTRFDSSLLMNSKIIVLGIGYLTLVFETVFIFIFWFKRFRLPLLIIGIGLHIGILIEFPIPLFAFAVLVLYVLMIPIKFWKILGYKSSINIETTDPIKPLKFGLLILSVFIITQGIVSLDSPFPRQVTNKIGFRKSPPGKFVYRLSKKVRKKSKRFLGITHHDVFLDKHFYNFNHLVAVVYKDGDDSIFLPLVKENGRPGEYNYGFNWARWAFRSNGIVIDQQALNDGIEDYTRFWAKKKKISLENTRFEIKVKKIRTAEKWERDYLKNQCSTPWLNGGYILWKDQKYITFLKDIEAI